jgi:hypothetical protein
MNVKETKVRLNDDQPERIEALVGKNRAWPPSSARPSSAS